MRPTVIDAPAALRALAAEIIGGAVVIAYIFVGVTAIVIVCTAIDNGKKVIRKIQSVKD